MKAIERMAIGIVIVLIALMSISLPMVGTITAFMVIAAYPRNKVYVYGSGILGLYSFLLTLFWFWG